MRYLLNDTVCGTGTLSVGVPELDVVFDGVGEDDEMTVGGFIGLNSDDDDANGVRDRMQLGDAIPGEDDYKVVTLAVSGLNPAGTVTLSVSGGLWISDQLDFSTQPNLTWPANAVPTTPFYVYGWLPSNTLRQEFLKLTYTGPDGPCEDEAKVTVYEVFGVEWIEVNSVLDTNPGGGFRIFPGKQTPTDTTNRRKVKARATIRPVIADRDVWFKVYDVDDPSSNMAPVDDETVPSDNRGTGARGHSPIDQQPAATNAQGQAEVEIEVGMQPGDNYRMVASVLDDYFENLDAVQDDGLNARIRNTSGNGWFVPPKYVSPILTVWRKLHLEVDSMEQEGNSLDTRPDEWAQVTMVAVTADVPSANLSTITVTPSLPSSNYLEGGSLERLDTHARWLIVRNSTTTVTVYPNMPPNAIGVMALLRDDDPYSAFHGDGFPQLAVTSVLTQSLTDAFAAAYIDVTELPLSLNPARLFPWESELSNVEILFDVASGVAGTAGWRDNTSTLDFWVRHLVIAYQPSASLDGDMDHLENCDISQNCLVPNQPYSTLGLTTLNAENYQFGTTSHNNVSGVRHSYVFVETIRDIMTESGGQLWQIVAHECGHDTVPSVSEEQEHNEEGLMAPGGKTSNQDDQSFSEETISRFRSAERF